MAFVDAQTPVKEGRTSTNAKAYPVDWKILIKADGSWNRKRKRSVITFEAKYREGKSLST